jgi:alkylhydroperoxidase family enzyme
MNSASSVRPVPLAVLEEEARKSLAARARVSLESDSVGLIAPSDDLEPTGGGRVPNYVKAFSDRPGVPAAVSTANGCRYCTLHVLLGLKRAGVDPSKLFAMKTDDAVLSSDERAVVEFARKLTRNPGSISDQDYGEITGAFGEKGAADIVLQTAYFAFMNRFNDAMKTPSEDLAIQNYREIYGSDWQP